MCSLCRERAAAIAAEVEAAEAGADIVALVVARRERYRTAARSAERTWQWHAEFGDVDDLGPDAWERMQTHLARAAAMSALLRDMGVTE